MKTTRRGWRGGDLGGKRPGHGGASRSARAEIPQWSAARAETPPDLGAMTIFEGGRDDDALRHLRQALTELDEYFRGERREFTVTLDPQGTDFYRAAWDEVARVPYGETRSYGEIAQAIGSPAAVRAVGAANGANPVRRSSPVIGLSEAMAA